MKYALRPSGFMACLGHSCVSCGPLFHWATVGNAISGTPPRVVRYLVLMAGSNLLPTMLRRVAMLSLQGPPLSRNPCARGSDLEASCWELGLRNGTMDQPVQDKAFLGVNGLRRRNPNKRVKLPKRNIVGHSTKRSKRLWIAKTAETDMTCRQLVLVAVRVSLLNASAPRSIQMLQTLTTDKDLRKIQRLQTLTATNTDESDEGCKQSQLPKPPTNAKAARMPNHAPCRRVAPKRHACLD